MSNTYKRFADNKRVEGPAIQLGDWVMLNSKNLKFKLGVKKLSPKFVGPFKVIKVVNKVSFRLKLPKSWKVFPVFHKGFLRLYTGKVNKEEVHPIVETGHKFEVEAILGERKVRGKHQFLVKWKNYSLDEASWQTVADRKNCSDLINAYCSSLQVKSLGAMS